MYVCKTHVAVYVFCVYALVVYIALYCSSSCNENPISYSKKFSHYKIAYAVFQATERISDIGWNRINYFAVSF